jgi:hypothetical protein
MVCCACQKIIVFKMSRIRDVGMTISRFSLTRRSEFRFIRKTSWRTFVELSGEVAGCRVVPRCNWGGTRALRGEVKCWCVNDRKFLEDTVMSNYHLVAKVCVLLIVAVVLDGCLEIETTTRVNHGGRD